MERRSSLSSYGVTLTDVHNMSPGLGRKPPLQRKQAAGSSHHSVPVGLLSIISSNFSATYTPMYSQRLDVLSIHIDNDIICVPKSLNLSGQTEILTILEERDKKRYGDTFKLSYLEQAKQDTAFFTYAYGTPNKNTKEYLKEQADEIAKRYLKAGHTELLVKLLQAGFVSRTGVNYSAIKLPSI